MLKHNSFKAKNIKLEAVNKPQTTVITSRFIIMAITSSNDVTKIQKSGSGNDQNHAVYPGTISVTGDNPVNERTQYNKFPAAVKTPSQKINLLYFIINTSLGVK
jgi:hypothetical protein